MAGYNSKERAQSAVCVRLSNLLYVNYSVELNTSECEPVSSDVSLGFSQTLVETLPSPKLS
ncbi:MAG: hypothetical protein ACI808_002183 [Paraglaciecola sp.]|jgi:hypothetical protein